LQWHGVRQCPGIVRLVRIGDDEPVHLPDKVIDALRARERDGDIDLPNRKARTEKKPQDQPDADRLWPVCGTFRVLYPGVAPARQLLLMLRAQLQVQLGRDAIELV
jgi:transcription antitermination factor NusG